MSQHLRLACAAAFTVTCAACGANANPGPAATPGVPIRTWSVLAADSAERSIYFRNDDTRTITIDHLMLDRCENIRQRCGDYPANLVIEPGKTVLGLKVQRFDRKLAWNYSFQFHSRSAPVLMGTTSMVGGGSQVIRTTAPIGGSMGPLKVIDVAEFKAAVPPLATGASCGVVRVPDLPEGHQALALMFVAVRGQRPARMVMVRYDANGSAYDYSDNREEVVDGAADGRRTTVSLDLVRQTGMLRNSGGGSPDEWFRVTGPGLPTAENLGRPADLITRAWKECRKS